MLSPVASSSTALDPFSHSIDPDIISTSEIKKKKKKKRARDEDHPQTEEQAGRKKKHKQSSGQSAQPTLAAPINVEPIQKAAPVKKKKKNAGKDKDKDKEKQQVISPAQQTDAEIEASSQASAAALLSAIVATMSNPHAAPQMQPFGSSLAPPPPGQHFVPFPPMPFGFPIPAHGTAHLDAFSNLAMSPPSNGAALSDLASGSNEDILRALQEIDIGKLTAALKNIGDPVGIDGSAPPPPHLPFMPPGAAPQHGTSELPVDRLPIAPPSKKAVSRNGRKRTIDMSLPGGEEHVNPSHAHMLATKWLNASKLAELVRDEGLVYRKGKFSAIEEQQLRAAIQAYQKDRQMNYDDLVGLIFSKSDKVKNTAFWSEITAAVPLRPIIAVYHHVRRIYHPCSRLGPWSPEEDEALVQGIKEYGQAWEKIGLRVGRMSSDCRDRYRNHIVNRDIRVTGPWSKEEEEQLTKIVTDMTIRQGKDIDNDVFWGKVSELMGGKRGRQQCRIKWTDALSKTVKNEGHKPRWSQQDAYILVHKIDSMNVRDDTEIDWKLMSDPDWNLWSAHALQRRWLTLKKGVKGHEDMTHQEIMDILRIKKSVFPGPPAPNPKKRKERKVTSAAAVNESDLRDSNEATPEAGPSTQNDASEDEDSE